MTNGDLADSAGLAVFPSGQDLRQGYDNDNIRGDELAAHMLTGGHDMSKITGVVAALAAKQAALGYTPVQQGTGAGQSAATVKVGYVLASGTLNVQVDATNLGDVRFLLDGQFGSSPIFTPHGRANPVTTGFVAAYINTDGRIGASASSRRYKKEIRAWSPDKQAILAMQLVTFRYKAAIYGSADAPVEAGLIAEDLHNLGLEWLVFYDPEGLPQGVHYDRIALALLPIVQDHEARLAALEGTVA